MSTQINPGYGDVSRALDGVDAVRTLHKIRSAARQYATAEERETLARWCGWGPLRDVFAPPNETWANMAEDLTAALSEKDFKLGMLGTPNAFYTPLDVAEQMWRLLGRLGFDAQHRKVGEFGCGGGAFMATAPDGVHVVGVERDPTAAAIAELCHPHHTVIAKPLQDITLPQDFAAVIGNVPFGRVKIFDPLAPDGSGVTRTLHHYFVWRALKALAPGGMAVLLISRYFMDGLDDEVRKTFDELADFIGAVRLPNGGLDGGTDIVSDIVVFRRKGIDERFRAARGESWRTVHRDRYGVDVNVNAYWEEHSHLVLGTMKEGSTTQHGLNLAVDPIAGESVADGLARVIGHLAQDARHMGLTWRPPVDASDFTAESGTTQVEDGWLENSYHIRDGKVFVVKDVGKAYIEDANGKRKRDKTVPPKLVASEIPRPGPELRALIGLRDMAERLVEAEADHSMPDHKVEALRTPLRRAYRAYVQKYGWLRRGTTYSKGIDPETGVEAFGRRVPPMGGFRHDPGAALVFALEVFDDEEQTGAMAPILTSRQNVPVVQPTHTDDPATALAWCLNRHGRFDRAYLASVLGWADGVSEEFIAGQLGDLVYQEPGYDTWLTAEEYLSGDVRAKLRAAETAALVDPKFQRNVDALTKALPKWLGPGEIMAALGTPWVPAKDVERFCLDLFGFGAGAKITHFKDRNRWDVEPVGARSSTAAAETWGTPDIDGYELIALALNGKTPEVRVRASKDKTKKDEARSLAAAEMQQRIKERFAVWIWEDAERCERLVNLYNMRYNCLVSRKFDGSHITIDGLAASWADKLYPHQKSYIARAVATPASLCGLPVGSGKTAMMICSAMKLAELGLATKPMLIVPNHLIEQIDADARQMFPGKKILSANSESISKSRRAFTARVATQHWDLIITTHSAFDRLPVHPATEVAYLEEAKARLHASLLEACPDGKLKGRQVKAMARKLDALEADIKTLQRRVYEDSGCTFEQLGVSWIGVDEAHNYANLAVPCYNDGFTISASKRASHLDMIMRWLSGRGNGRYGALFTGTPIKNTMLQLYVMMQYLMPEYLASIELGSADAWVAAYVEMVTKVGVTVDGGKFELQTKPAKFINAPEIRVMFSMVADIQTADDLGLKRPAEVLEVIKVQPTTKQQIFSQILVSRAAALKGVRFPEEGADNMLKVCNDGRWSATDPYLVGIRDDEPGKLHACAEQIIKLWREYPDDVQLVFCDVGTPNDAKGNQTYGRLRRILTEMGMPVHLIEFAHSAKSDADKAAQFRRARQGKLKVLVGSTGKMGTGTNVQDRVIGMHHLDAPFTPAAVEQRDGRGLRPGNRNKRVFNFRYVTARTFDAYLWQLLVRKLGFISQLMTGSLDRSIEDVETDQLLGFAAVQASATDQPLLMEREDVAGEVSRLRSGQAAHRQMHQRQRMAIPLLKQQIAKRQAELKAWEAIAAAEVPELTEEVGKALHTAMGEYAWRSPRLELGGLTVSFGHWVTAHNEQREPELRVDGGGGYMTERLYSSFKPETILKRLAELILKAEAEIPALGNLIAGLHKELAEKERLLTEPYAKEDELTAKAARLDQLDAELRKQAAAGDDPDAKVVDGDDDQDDPAGPVKLTDDERRLLAEIESGAQIDVDGTMIADLLDQAAGVQLSAPVSTPKPVLAPEPDEQPASAAVEAEMQAMFAAMMDEHEAKYRQEMNGLAAMLGL